jgi:membrane fusion protein (multidrug efflux system)
MNLSPEKERDREIAAEAAAEPAELAEPADFAEQPAAGRRFPRPRRERAWRLYVAAAAAAAVVAGAAWWLHRQFTHVTETDARVAADMVVISSRLPGWVTEVGVAEGDAVRQGQLLVRIDDRENRVQARELEAQLDGIPRRRDEIAARLTLADRQTQGEIAAQQAAVKAAEAAVAGAQAQRVLAAAEHDRIVDLVRQGMVTQLRQDQTLAALETARQQVSSAEANLQKARAALAQAQAGRENLTVLQRQLAELGPEEERLRAQRARTQLDLDDRAVLMPFDGVVNRLFIDKGEYVSPGQRLLMVHDPERVRVEVNIKETDIRYFRPGKPVTLTVDALPGRSFEGTVERVGQAATSEFALLPNPNPSGNFTKITQRLPVRITVKQVDGLLKPGMMVEVEARADE